MLHCLDKSTDPLHQDTSLRPKLSTGVASHTSVKAKHNKSQTLVDLLSTVEGAKAANTNVQTLLNTGVLEQAIPALQAAEVALHQAEPWMHKSAQYRAEKVRPILQSTRTSSREPLKRTIANIYECS